MAARFSIYISFFSCLSFLLLKVVDAPTDGPSSSHHVRQNTSQSTAIASKELFNPGFPPLCRSVTPEGTLSNAEMTLTNATVAAHIQPPPSKSASSYTALFPIFLKATVPPKPPGMATKTTPFSAARADASTSAPTKCAAALHSEDAPLEATKAASTILVQPVSWRAEDAPLEATKAASTIFVQPVSWRAEGVRVRKSG